MRRTAENAQKRPLAFPDPRNYAGLQHAKRLGPRDADCRFPRKTRLETGDLRLEETVLPQDSSLKTQAFPRGGG